MADSAKKLSKPTHWDELYPGRFLKAGELLGRKVTLTIVSVEREVLEDEKGKKVKGILVFGETEKQVALNKTNGICLREMFGTALAAWIGKRVVLYEGRWDGEPCVRIWGSPDIPVDLAITVQLPRRKGIPMVMHCTRARATLSQSLQPSLLQHLDQQQAAPRATVNRGESTRQQEPAVRVRAPHNRHEPLDLATPADSWAPPDDAPYEETSDPEPGAGDAP